MGRRILLTRRRRQGRPWKKAKRRPSNVISLLVFAPFACQPFVGRHDERAGHSPKSLRQIGCSYASQRASCLSIHITARGWPRKGSSHGKRRALRGFGLSAASGNRRLTVREPVAGARSAAPQFFWCFSWPVDSSRQEAGRKRRKKNGNGLRVLSSSTFVPTRHSCRHVMRYTVFSAGVFRFADFDRKDFGIKE